MLVTSSFAMYFFEATASSLEDFGPEYLHWIKRVGRGLYRSMTTYTMMGSYNPSTPAGRLYSIVFQFNVLLVQSAYTANLAAFFTRTVPAVMTITSLADFSSTNTPACMMNETMQTDYMTSLYPDVQIVAQDVTSLTPLLRMELNGACGGIVAPDVALYYALGPGDAANDYCAITPVGTAVGSLMYGLPWGRNSSATRDDVAAMNALITDVLAFGFYQPVQDSQFPSSRSAGCQNIIDAAQAAMQSADAMEPLGLKHLAGVFFIQALGLVAGFAAHFVASKRGVRRFWQAKRIKLGEPGGEGGDGDEGGEGGDGEEDGEGGGGGRTAAGSRLRRNMREIPLNAMMNIEQSMDRAMRQFKAIQEQQRAIDVVYMIQQQDTSGPGAAPNARVPLHIMSKMDRAVGFGLHGIANLTLLDRDNVAVGRITYEVTEGSELSQAFIKMGDKEAQDFDARVTEFLRARTEHMRRKRADRAARAVMARSTGTTVVSNGGNRGNGHSRAAGNGNGHARELSAPSGMSSFFRGGGGGRGGGGAAIPRTMLDA